MFLNIFWAVSMPHRCLDITMWVKWNNNLEKQMQTNPTAIMQSSFQVRHPQAIIKVLIFFPVLLQTPRFPSEDREEDSWKFKEVGHYLMGWHDGLLAKHTFPQKSILLRQFYLGWLTGWFSLILVRLVFYNQVIHHLGGSKTKSLTPTIKTWGANPQETCY